ncbi:ATP-binding cassette subfamily B protein [Pectinatus cerevisiiphilus]|uniref:ATP-binding cassette subfamily B protein n=1 Tax=Pectinatus cerevisiiphilus TaxID=86956 RepID=A0A4V2USL9_9FIRM|nr:ATP-binding cassette subfamily B protein [Pectinatus cerevisiiphilus]
MVTLFKLAVFLKDYKKECFIGPIFKLFEAILELLLPTMMVFIINNGVAKHDLPYVLRMGGWMLGMAILGFCCSMVCQYFAAKASQGFGTTLRNTVFQHIQSLSHTELDNLGTASLINRITNDINQLQLAVAMLIRLVVRTPFICIGAIVMSMLLDLRLSLLLWGAAPIFALLLYFIVKRSSRLYSSYQKKLDRTAAVLRENLEGVRVIRAFAKIQKEKKRFYKTNDDLMANALQIGHVSALLNPLTTFIMNTVIIMILWVGSSHINEGTLAKGQIIAFANYVTQILLALIVISNLVVIFTKAFASATRVNQVLDTVSSLPESSVSIPLSANNDAPLISLHDVSFKYSSTGDMALSHLNIDIHSGETVGIIGSTGSGKSTFVNLLPRFYDTTEGQVLIEGVDVRNWELAHLRKKFGIVPQKAILFTGTIEENLRWGDEKASLDELQKAAQISQAAEFIDQLPDGYKTMVERGGLNFSGGQKQRLTIARALVKKPEILILDDSTSALDFATDAAVRFAIRKNYTKTTVLIVSQRASSIKYADKILVFNDGLLAGCGTHTALIKDCEVYREICLSQLSSKEVYA